MEARSSTVSAPGHSPPGGGGRFSFRRPPFAAHLGADVPASLVAFLWRCRSHSALQRPPERPLWPAPPPPSAAGLTVLVAGLVQEFGWQVTCAITAAAGVVPAPRSRRGPGRLA